MIGHDISVEWTEAEQLLGGMSEDGGSSGLLFAPIMSAIYVSNQGGQRTEVAEVEPPVYVPEPSPSVSSYV
jgi:hypothetical protein